MAQAISLKRFFIPKNEDNQPIWGKLSTSNTYTAELKDDSTLTFGIHNVEFLDNGDIVFSYIINWTEKGPEYTMNKDGSLFVNTVKMSDMKSASPKFIKFVKAPKLPRSSGKNDFIFIFDTVKGSQDYGLNKSEFICALVKLNEVNRKSVYGYIVNVDDVTHKVEMEECKSYGGMYTVNKVVLDLEDIVGIFKYNIDISELIRKSAKTTNTK